MLLEQRILDLQKNKGALIDKVRELKNEVARLTNENKTFKDENAELKKENTELKTRWECRHKYMCSDNGRGVPCYIYITVA